MTAVANVDHINKNNTVVRKEIEALQNSVSSLNWTLRVPLIGDTLGFGYRAVEAMKNYDEPLVSGSLGQRAGFDKIGDIVTAPFADGGFGLDWDDWSESVTAYIYRRKFSIPHAKKEEILAEHQDIVETLGYEPKDAIQYHKVKSELINNAKNRRDKAHNEEVRLLRTNIYKLNEDIDGLRSTEANLKRKVEQYMSELEASREKIQGMSAEYSKSLNEAVKKAEVEVAERLKADFESKMAHQKTVMVDLEERLERALEELSNHETSHNEIVSDYEAKLEGLQVDYQSKLDLNMESIQELEGLVAEYRRKIDSLSAESERSESTIAELKLKVEKLSSLPLAGPEVLSQIEDLEKQVESQQLEIQSLNNSIVEKDTTIEEQNRSIKEQKHLLERTKVYIKKYREEVRKKLDSESKKSQKMRAQLETANKARKQAEALHLESHQKLNSSMRQRGILMVITAASIAIAVYTLMV